MIGDGDAGFEGDRGKTELILEASIASEWKGREEEELEEDIDEDEAGDGEADSGGSLGEEETAEGETNATKGGGNTRGDDWPTVPDALVKEGREGHFVLDLGVVAAVVDIVAGDEERGLLSRDCLRAEKRTVVAPGTSLAADPEGERGGALCAAVVAALQGEIDLASSAV